MSGSLSQVRPGVWRVRVFAGRKPDGKQTFRSATFEARNKREAERKVNEHVARLEREIRNGRPERGAFGELVDEWLEHQRSTGKEASTLYRLTSIVAEIKAGLGKTRLDKITARDIDRFYATLREQNIARPTKADIEAKRDPAPRYRSESTIHHYHRVLTQIIRQGSKWGMIDRSVIENATAPKQRRRSTAKAPDTALLIEMLADCPPDLRVAAALAARTGLRRGELMALHWSDIDWQRRTLRAWRALADVPGRGLTYKATKTGEVRVIDLDDVTIAALDSHRRALAKRAHEAGGTLAADGPVFANIAADVNGAFPRSPSWLSLAWKRHCAGHGAKIRLHDLRHWHATYLIDQGIPITTVAERLGHAQTSTTLNIYAHAVAGTGRAAADLMARALPVGGTSDTIPER